LTVYRIGYFFEESVFAGVLGLSEDFVSDLDESFDSALGFESDSPFDSELAFDFASASAFLSAFLSLEVSAFPERA
jgi:hypothetical protein